MSNTSNVHAPDVQRCSNDISARLAKEAKDPPDLAKYLQVHAECINQALNPRGFSYEMLNGSNFQRVVGKNLEDLNFRESPQQEESFRRLTRKVANERAPALLKPFTLPTGAEGMRGLEVEDAPAAEELPFFNRTPFQHIFVPIPLENDTAGILRAWFVDGDAQESQARLTILEAACREIELYFKTRRVADVTQELTRLNTYKHLLEELSGDLDLETVSWNLVNYAREAVSCDRVSIFTVRKYNRDRWNREASLDALEYHFEACSGLKKPHPRSEQGELLKAMAKEMVFSTIPKKEEESKGLESISEAPSGPESEEDGSSRNGKRAMKEGDAEKGKAPESVKKPEKALVPAPRSKPPKIRLALVERDASKVETRSEAINAYFDHIPMNWATVVPLFDWDYRVCGMLLFEGREQSEDMRAGLFRMRDLTISGGRALGTALYWHQSKSLRSARVWNEVRGKLAATPNRTLFWKVALPMILAIAILVFPLPYKIDGEATILPRNFRSLPALVSARMNDVRVREGDTIREGQVLARLDTRDIEIQLRQARQEFERYMTEADRAQSVGRETEMQIARLNARKISATIERLSTDIEKATIRAPFDGLVVGPPNLSQEVGKVTGIGESIIEVAQPGDWDVKVEVREQDLVYLESRFRDIGELSAELKLTADPTRDYNLLVSDSSQFAYGLETSSSEYSFALILPMEMDAENTEILKVGFAGKVKIDGGIKPIGYILFHDFVNFIKLRWF